MWDTAIEIPDLSRMEGDAQIAEALAGQVREGQPVTLHLDAHPDVEYRGHVQLISRSVQVTSWRNPLKVVRLVVALDATDPETMRPGMRFRGTVETERLENVVTVPLGAVFPSPDGPVVVRRELTGWHEVAVRLGRRNKERVEVLDGIDAGDRLALEREAS
jgi:multidrug efflux pump subunit AcrA (membrane-fusion protein)